MNVSPRENVPLLASVGDALPEPLSGVPLPARLADGLGNREEEADPNGTDLAPTALALHIASNPLDYFDLFEAGFREWYKTSDARINGRLVPFRRLLHLFRSGFVAGGMELVLMQRLPQDGDERLDLIPVNKDPGTAVRRQGDALIERRDGDDVVVHSSLLSQTSIVGFDAVSRWGGWLQGHLLYLRPEYRGKGLCRAYFLAMLDFCRENGFEGFRFLSTLPHWKGATIGNVFDRRLHLVQKGGVPVYVYSKAVI